MITVARDLDDLHDKRVELLRLGYCQGAVYHQLQAALFRGNLELMRDELVLAHSYFAGWESQLATDPAFLPRRFWQLEPTDHFNAEKMFSHDMVRRIVAAVLFQQRKRYRKVLRLADEAIDLLCDSAPPARYKEVCVLIERLRKLASRKQIRDAYK